MHYLIKQLTIFTIATLVFTSFSIANTNTDKNPTLPHTPKGGTQGKYQIIKIPSGEVKITLPTVPTPVKAIQLTDTNDRAIKFSKRVPPNYIPHRFTTMKKKSVLANTHIGEVNHGHISAYLRGKLIDINEITKRLKKFGFTILSSAPINEKKTLISVVFTHPDLIKIASKANRGFIAALRILVDTKEKKISITNPLYMSKGFLQSDFDEKIAKNILAKIINAFPHLTNSKDVAKFQLLSTYQFMKGMPRYEDMLEVASGDDLLERIKENKNVVFTQTLESGSVLIGVQLEKETRQFIKKIGRNNAAILPYPVLIENKKAKMLDPKYYISFMYPLLKMSEFMTIATVPDAMYKDVQRALKKR